MIILHCIGEMVLLSGAFVVLPYYGYTTTETWHIVYSSFIARTIMSIILLPGARLVIWFIQHHIEEVVVFDYKTDFKIFKLGTNPTNSVQFNAKSWFRVDTSKINVRTMAKRFYSSSALVNIKIF